MIGAVLDTRRRALGLSIAETAALIGKEERLVNRWIDGRGEPDDPARLLLVLDRLEEIMEGLIDGMLSAATDLTASGPVKLLRYRTQDDLDADMSKSSGHQLRLPLGAHAMLVAWADDQLAAQGIEAQIEWSD